MKLNFEIVPDGCWYANLRSILSKKQWDYIRRIAYNEADGRCSICKRRAGRLEAHERWSYNLDTPTQKLEEVIAVCHQCHSVIHIGRTQLIGQEDTAIKHFCYVNKCGFSEYIAALTEAVNLNNIRNAVSEWRMDLSYLSRYVDT